MLAATRPETVQDAIREKFAAITGNSDKPMKWVNMGTRNEKLFFDGDNYVMTGDLIKAIQRENSNDEHKDLLDLGTARGDLLLFSRDGYGLSMDKMVGVSAIDYRQLSVPTVPSFGPKSIPDSSYKILNLDELNGPTALEPPGDAGFNIIFSSHTLYHLVDPVPLLQIVYNLLAPRGTAVLRHMPFAACCSINLDTINTLYESKGFNIHFTSQLDAPGLATVWMYKSKSELLPMPFEYTGSIVQAGGMKSYCYATHNFTSDTPNASSSSDRAKFVYNLCCARLNIPVHHLADPTEQLIFLAEKLSESNLAQAAHLAAAAFIDSPCYKYIFSAPTLFTSALMAQEDRLSALTWLFNANFWIRCVQGHGPRGTFTDHVLQDKITCCFNFLQPEVGSLSPTDLVRAGLLRMPFLFGIRSVGRLLEVMDWFEKKEAEIINKYIHDKQVCKLERMAVAPGSQGQGLGSRALLEIVDDACRKGQVVMLATQLKENVRFYTRLNFIVVDDEAFTPESGKPIPNWMMVRFS